MVWIFRDVREGLISDCGGDVAHEFWHYYQVKSTADHNARRYTGTILERKLS